MLLKQFRLCLSLLLATVLEVQTAPASDLGGDVAVVSYLPEWRYEGANWETICEHSTHLLLFSPEPDAKGNIVALDRIPRKELLEEARRAATRHGTQLMLSFGGNGRSDGFSGMSRKKKARARFVEKLVVLLDKLDLDGVDYNWEYPGYSFRSGYLPDKEVEADYKGLTALLRDTKLAFAANGRARAVTMAYYPDGRQERLIKEHGIDKHADLMHMMSYDQTNGHHSTFEFGRKTAQQGKGILQPAQLTLGLPFYGRHNQGWVTYEDLVQEHGLEKKPELNDIGGAKSIGFNGVTTIEAKTALALTLGLGGVMIWEVGQDCRLEPVTHGKDVHKRTCPTDDSSLLLAITRAIKSSGRKRMRVDGWQPQEAASDGRAAEL